MGNEDINMMLFGDLHYSDKFNDDKILKLNTINVILK